MKLMHISDLHIGKKLFETSMLEDQRYILNRILDLLDDERPDAVLIAGDVYDGFRNHNGNKLSHATMAHIIRNSKYKGYFCGNKVGTEDMFTKKMVFKPESEWVMFKDERIVPAI